MSYVLLAVSCLTLAISCAALWFAMKARDAILVNDAARWRESEEP